MMRLVRQLRTENVSKKCRGQLFLSFCTPFHPEMGEGCEPIPVAHSRFEWFA